MILRMRRGEMRLAERVGATLETRTRKTARWGTLATTACGTVGRVLTVQMAT
jgi:hypothetical protein